MKIKTIQFSPKDGKKEPNIRELEEIFKKHEFSKTDLVLLPELWSTGVDFDAFNDLSEEIPGKTTNILSNIADRENIYLCGGSIVEEQGNSMYNTSTFYDKEGNLVGKYRKIHLFSYSDEDDYLLSGNSLEVVKTDFGKIGLTICYDLRFPTQYRKMALNNVKIILCPSAWPNQRKQHWNILNRARAIENQCFLISCNRKGKYEENNFEGNSLITDPNGEIIFKGRNEKIKETEIDLSEADKIRKDFPTLRDYKEI